MQRAQAAACLAAGSGSSAGLSSRDGPMGGAVVAAIGHVTHGTPLCPPAPRSSRRRKHRRGGGSSLLIWAFAMGKL